MEEESSQQIQLILQEKSGLKNQGKDTSKENKSNGMNPGASSELKERCKHRGILSEVVYN
jgi:hypothetical protein